MNDKELRQTVVAELEFEPTVNTKHIGVTDENRVVTLTGHVSSYVEKIDVVDAVKKVRGVRAVADEIEVGLFHEKKNLSDDEIAKRALDVITWDIVLPPGAIQLVVHNGWVTLSGEVQWRFEKEAAEGDVRKL